MSHFTVAVITSDPNNLEKLLAPYQENNMGDCPKEFLVFNDEEQAYLDGYETHEKSMIKLADGTIIDRYDDRCYVSNEQNRRTWQLPEGAEEVKIPVKEIYASAEEYVQEECEYDLDPETGKRGYWENPNRKWDWYQVGGRWSNMILLKNGGTANSAKIKDIFFAEDPVNAATDVVDELRGDDNTVVVAGFRVPEGLSKTLRASVKEAADNWDTVMSGKGWYKPEYYTARYATKDDYIRECLLFGTFAVLTADGKWHSKGEMGWFGMSSETPEEASEFSNSYFDTFIKTADPEHYLIVVDCHI